MDLLFLTPQLPYPAYQGTSLRNLHILRGVAQAHRVTLLSFGESTEAQPPPGPLAEICAEIMTVPTPERPFRRRLWQMVATQKPDMALRLHAPAYDAMLQSLLQRRSFDVIQIEGIELAWTIPTIRKAAPGVPILYDAHNAETLLQARAGAADRGNLRRLPAVFYSKLQSSRLASYEAWVCKSADRVTAVSEGDSKALEALAGLGPGAVTVIPNSIDVAAYQPAASGDALQDDRYRFDIVFSGKMDYRPNVDAALWFADEIWPLLKKQVPGLTWAIVGQKPHPRLRRLETLPGVTLTGWVPDVMPYMAGAKIFIMPFRVGSGTRLKLIEALASGRAVVSTTVGVEGFPVVDEQQVLLGDTAEAFADAVLALLGDAQKRAVLGENGRQFAQKYDWRVVVPRFQPIYDGLAIENIR